MTPTTLSITRKTTDFGTVTAVTPSANARPRDQDDHADDQVASAPDTSLPVPAVRPDSGQTRRFTENLKPQAAVVAHLIATHLGLPQTRTLRRAGTTQADTAYRFTETLAPDAIALRDRRV
jgi:hypothetical protein